MASSPSRFPDVARPLPFPATTSASDEATDLWRDVREESLAVGCHIMWNPSLNNRSMTFIDENASSNNRIYLMHDDSMSRLFHEGAFSRPDEIPWK